MAIAIDSRQARRPGFVPPAAMVRIGQRVRAFQTAQRHSLLVRILRILLPIAVVGILGGYAAVVTVNSTLLPKIKIGGIEITADDLTMKDPVYFDTTSDGRYEVRARRAIVSFGQKKETPIKLIDVSGELVKKNGEITALKAKNGLYDNAKGELELLDGIEIDGSTGVMARLTRALIFAKDGKVVSTDPVSANMPAGSVQAGSMTMSTKTKLVELRGGVSVRLVAQEGRTLAAGKDARQPVDIRAEELDIDDGAKTAHFRGKVVAIQGETMLQAPSLLIKYEGKAAAAMEAVAETAKAKKEGGARVTFLWARGGVEITAGSDRRITSDLADFDVAAETAVFDGNVVAEQDKNVLKGGRLSIDKKAGKTRLETPDGGRILATFVPTATTALKPVKRPPPGEVIQGAIMGGFKADRTAPMAVEADLLELIDGAGMAVFTGDVRARQGEMLMRTSLLTALYTGQAGLGLSDAGDAAVAPVSGKGREKSEIVRLEARQSVIVSSGAQTATAKWADFDVKGNTALLGGGVVLDKMVKDAENPTEKKMNLVIGERLRMDLTTGIYHVEAEPAPSAPTAGVIAPKADAAGGKGALKATSSSAPTTAGATPEDKARACAPGKTCILVFPEKKIRKKAMETLKKKAPEIDGQ
jgi:lipopolysaccharide export system protein LptA